MGSTSCSNEGINSNPKSEFVTLAANYQGAKFNSPNDLVGNQRGELYFTDPPYGLIKKEKDPNKEIEYQEFFYLGKMVMLIL